MPTTKRAEQRFKVVLLPLWLALSLFLLFCKKESTEHCDQPVQSSSTARQGWDFILQSNDGPFDSRSLRGQTVLIYFGFTACPDVCPTTLASVSRALKALPAKDQDRTQLLFISVDPERDTPERLKNYAAHFHPRIRPLWGSPDELQRVAALFGAKFERQKIDSAMGYTMDHTPDLFVLSPEGKLADIIPHGVEPEVIARALQIQFSKTE